jgi:hypothetical protein
LKKGTKLSTLCWIASARDINLETKW